MTEHKNLTAKEAIQNFQKAFGYTNEAIKKALAYCGSIDKDCENCVFCDEKGCEDMLKRVAIGLIERQGAEIERLTVELDGMRGAATSLKMHYENARQEIERLKDYNTGVAFKHYFDGIKEFAERLKAQKIKPEFPWDDFVVTEGTIDELLREMTEGGK